MSVPVAGLDEAWAAVEAALPVGWDALHVYRFDDEWTVRFDKKIRFGRGGASRYARWTGEGVNFAAALQDLVHQLRTPR